MKKVMKIIGKVFLVIVFLIILLLVISYINHRIQLSREDAIFQPIGSQVEVNGHLMNVYTEGSGSKTLVFLSGGGTCSPVLDFKSLYSQLNDTYKIVVIEKAGYGFSDITNSNRDIDTVLSETREALAQAGIVGPYVLCPHSMSGIESLYWAQQYPEEVEAIIGLDMAVPHTYSDYKINVPLLKLGSFAANMGVTRWLPGIAESDAIKYGNLTEEEKDLYRAVFYRRTGTKDMITEVQQIKTSAKKVEEGEIPHIPILIFSSNGSGTGFQEEDWRVYLTDFINACPNGSLIELDCSHYVHDIEYERIASEIRLYLNN